MPCIDGNPKLQVFVSNCFRKITRVYCSQKKCVWILGLLEIYILGHIYGHICSFLAEFAFPIKIEF